MNSPVSSEIWATKRGGAKLQAATSSELCRVEKFSRKGGAGRARCVWAKAAVRAVDSGAARNRSGVEETACSEGQTVNWGGVRPNKPLFLRVSSASADCPVGAVVIPDARRR